MAGWLCSPVTPFSLTNKSDRHNISEISLKAALSTITPYAVGEMWENVYVQTIKLAGIFKLCIWEWEYDYVIVIL